MQKGFSILYKPAQKETDNTLITILGKPNSNGDSWHDNLVRIIIGQLYTNIPNAHTLQIINNETPLITRLKDTGLLTANQVGSIQALDNFAFTDNVKTNAEKQGREPLDLVCEMMHQGLMSGLCDAEPFLDKAVTNLKNDIKPIFTFDEDAQDIVRWLGDISGDLIFHALKTHSIRTGNYVVWKNAVISEALGNPFTATHYNNLVLIDTSHSDDAYIKQWKYLEPDDFVDFQVIASNTDFTRYAQATPQILADFVSNELVGNTLKQIVCD